MNTNHFIIPSITQKPDPVIIPSLLSFFSFSRSYTPKIPHTMAETCPLPSIAKCTVDTCPLSCAQLDYLPSLAGNALFATLFALLLAVQVGLGIRFKAWGFMAGMVCGLILELVGYAGRIMLHGNPFNFNNFIM